MSKSLSSWPSSTVKELVNNVNIMDLNCLSVAIKDSQQDCDRLDASPCDLWDLAIKFSTVSKLFRVTAYCLRFICKLRQRMLLGESTKLTASRLLNHSFLYLALVSHDQRLSNMEHENARLLWAHLQQKASFPDELKALSFDRPLNRRSSFLNPYCNED